MTRYYSSSSRVRAAMMVGAAAVFLAVAGTSPAFAQTKNSPAAPKPATNTAKTIQTVPAPAAPSVSVAEALDHAAALRTEAELRAYQAPTMAVATGYNDASSGMTRMLSLLGQYDRVASVGSKAPASRTEAQLDVNALWSAAGKTTSSVWAGRLRRAAYLYARAAGRYFAAETREGRPPTTTVADAGGTNADGTATSTDAAAAGTLTQAPYNGQANLPYYTPYYSPTYVISPGYGYGNQVIVPGGFYGYGGGLLTISPYGQVGIW